MALTTRKPSGLAPWPVVLLAGRPKAGKSYTAALFSASEVIGRTFWIEVGETTADQYGAIPGVRYEIVGHDGSYAGIRKAIRDACAEPNEPGRPNAIVIDSFGKIWELLSDEAQVMANRREAAKAARQKKPAPDPDADFTVGTDLWNRAKKRWYVLLNELQAFAGPVILLSRLDETTVMSPSGEPTKDKVWKAKAQKDLVFDVDVVMEARAFQEWQLTGVRSVTYQLPKSGTKVIPDFSVEKLLIGLGVTTQAGSRNAVALNPDALDPEERPSGAASQQAGRAATSPVKPLPADFKEMVAECEASCDVAGLTDLGVLAGEAGNQIAKAAATAAWKRVVASLRARYDTDTAQHDLQALVARYQADQAPEAAVQ